MGTAIIIIITFLAAFWIGSGYGRSSHHRKGSYLLGVFVTILAIVSSILGIAGLIQFVSPTLFISLAGKLPGNFQDILFLDLLLAGTRLWIFAIVAGVLWWVRTKI